MSFTCFLDCPFKHVLPLCRQVEKHGWQPFTHESDWIEHTLSMDGEQQRGLFRRQSVRVTPQPVEQHGADPASDKTPQAESVRGLHFSRMLAPQHGQPLACRRAVRIDVERPLQAVTLFRVISDPFGIPQPFHFPVRLFLERFLKEWAGVLDAALCKDFIGRM